MDIRPDALGPDAAPQLEELFTQVLGVPFCPPDTPLDADEQCIKPRVANRNPTLERLLYSTTGGGGFGFGGGGGGRPITIVLIAGCAHPASANGLNGW